MQCSRRTPHQAGLMANVVIVVASNFPSHNANIIVATVDRFSVPNARLIRARCRNSALRKRYVDFDYVYVWQTYLIIIKIAGSRL